MENDKERKYRRVLLTLVISSLTLPLWFIDLEFVTRALHWVTISLAILRYIIETSLSGFSEGLSLSTILLPVALQTQKDTLNSIVSLITPLPSSSRGHVMLVVTNQRKRSAREWYKSFKDFYALHKNMKPEFRNRIKASVYVTRRIRGRVVTVGLKLRVAVRSNELILLDSEQQLVDEVNLRFTRISVAYKRDSIRGLRTFVKAPRENPESVPAFTSHWFYSPDSGFQDFGNTNYDAYRREFASVRTPNFQTLKKKGQLPNNPHHVEMWHHHDGGFYEEHEYLATPQFSSYTYQGNMLQFGTAHGGPSPGISHFLGVTKGRNTAVRRLQGQVGETQNLAETISTINLTTRMIGNATVRLAKAFLAVKRLNFSKAANILFAASPSKFKRDSVPDRTKDLASNWLALQYGWKPLLNDIHYLMEAVGKLALPDLSVASIRSSATSKSREVIDLHINSGGSPPSIGYVLIQTRSTVKFILRYKLHDPLQSFLSQSGFTNPVSLAWELLPGSFVADWFLPIGPYLESLQAWNGLQFIDGCETQFTRKEYHYVKSYEGNTLPDGDVHPNDKWTIRGYRDDYGILLDRFPLGGFPSQTAPIFKNPFSVTHALNGLALLRQVFGASSPRLRYSL